LFLHKIDMELKENLASCYILEASLAAFCLT
jgi:hypothetical protein